MTEVRITVEGAEHIVRMTVPENLMGPGLRDALTRSVIDIENGAKRAAPVDRGRLRGAITHQVDDAPLPMWAKAGVIGGVSGGGGHERVGEYAFAMEYGRPPGSMPPLEPIAAWARRKGITTPPFAIALAIKRHGTKARRFMEGGVNSALSNIQRHFINASRDIENRWRNNV